MKRVIFIVLLIASAIGCKKDNDNSAPNDLLGTWRLVGFVENGTLREATPSEKECPSCFTITFKQDKTFQGKSSTNILMGQYEFDYTQKTFSILNVGGTEIDESDDGRIFVDMLGKANQYEVKENQLRLYRNEGKQLLFQKK